MSVAKTTAATPPKAKATAPTVAAAATVVELSEEEKEQLAEFVSMDSTMLDEVAFDANSEVLQAIFQNGDEAEYDCTLTLYKDLLATSSPGKFMWEYFL